MSLTRVLARLLPVTACVTVLVAVGVLTTSAATAAPIGTPTITEVVAPAPSGITNPVVESIACAKPGTCFAVGYGYAASTSSYPGLMWTLAGGTWTAARLPVPRGRTAAEVYSIACPSATLCRAAGDAYSNTGSVAYLLTWNDSSWSGRTVAGPTLGNVGCSAAGFCMASNSQIVSYTGADSALSFATITSSATSTVKVVIPKKASLIHLGTPSCYDQTCIVLGQYTTPGVKGERSFSVTVTGSASRFVTLPAPAGVTGVVYEQLDQISCPSAGRCYAVGYYSTDTSAPSMVAGPPYEPFVARKANGTWTTATTAEPSDGGGADYPDLAGVISPGIDCPTLTSCTSAGTYRSANLNQKGLVQSITPASVTGVSKDALWEQYGDVRCTAPNQCLAVGSARLSDAMNAQGEVAVISGSAVTSYLAANPADLPDGYVVALTRMACAPGTTSCAALGTSSRNTYYQGPGILATISTS